MKLFNNINKIKVKICGLAKMEDIVACKDLGVDAVGFLLGNSKGQFPTDKLSKEEAKVLINEAPSEIATVLLVKSNDNNEIAGLLNLIHPSAIQLQSQSLDSDAISNLKNNYPEIDFIKTIKLDNSDTFEIIWRKIHPFIGCVDAVLLDSAKGGSGKIHNWNVSRQINEKLRQFSKPLVLAGGITPDNVREAINIVEPSMVDVMSGVSSQRGIKDILKVRALLKAIL